MLTLPQLNYLTKYLELLDTCFLFLKKKPLSKPRRNIRFAWSCIADTE